jgi:hypothetical protein
MMIVPSPVKYLIISYSTLAFRLLKCTFDPTALALLLCKSFPQFLSRCFFDRTFEIAKRLGIPSEDQMAAFSLGVFSFKDTKPGRQNFKASMLCALKRHAEIRASLRIVLALRLSCF